MPTNDYLILIRSDRIKIIKGKIIKAKKIKNGIKLV